MLNEYMHEGVYKLSIQQERDYADRRPSATLIQRYPNPTCTGKLVTDPVSGAYTNSAYPNPVHTSRAHNDSAHRNPTRPIPCILFLYCRLAALGATGLASLGARCETLKA
jgi:hypothetical protein